MFIIGSLSNLRKDLNFQYFLPLLLSWRYSCIVIPGASTPCLKKISRSSLKPEWKVERLTLYGCWISKYPRTCFKFRTTFSPLRIWHQLNELVYSFVIGECASFKSCWKVPKRFNCQLTSRIFSKNYQFVRYCRYIKTIQRSPQMNDYEYQFFWVLEQAGAECLESCGRSLYGCIPEKL